MPFKLGPLELVIILVVILVLFGPKNLPKLGAAIGKSVKNLREGMGSGKDKKKEDEEEEADKDKAEEVELIEETTAEAEEAEAEEEAPKKKTVKRVVKK